MRIACLQFAPQLADTDQNIERADAILERADPGDIDLLVLPELAFSGYNFKSLRQISPHLELGESGVSAAWSRQAALKYNCVVVTGYPEKVDLGERWPADVEFYNSAIIINGDGDVAGNYRKSHLYYTDETWALEGGRGFYAGRVPGLGHLVVGICMDINPYKFEAPWEAYEFSSHILDTGARLVVLSMAWCTHADQEEFFLNPDEPDMDTLLYWIARLQPIISIDSSQETIVVFGNRCGAEGDTTYVGTSTVIGIKSGEISLYGILGRSEESLLVVDTDALPYAKLKLKSPEPGPAQHSGEDTRAPQVQPAGGLPAQPRNESGPGTGGVHDMGTNQEPPADDVPEHTLEAILVNRGPERDPHRNDHWLEPSRRPREHPTSGPFRVDGSSIGIPFSSCHISHTQFTQSHVAAPVTQKHDMGEMRATMSEGNYGNNRMDDFSESDEESSLSGPFSESDEAGWPCAHESKFYNDGQRRGTAGNQRDNMIQDSGGRNPSAHRSQTGLPKPHPEQDDALESCLMQMMSAFALDNEGLLSSKTENFKEEDIYKFVHGKNLTSEHHIRYHTHLLRKKRARQGLPVDVGNAEEDLEIYQEEDDEDDDAVFGAHLDSDAPRHDPGLDAQPNYAHGFVTESRQAFWMERSAEPTPIADTPMCYMTQFSPAQTRQRHKRQAPAFPMVDSGQTRRQSRARHAGQLDSGAKTGDTRVGETRIGIASELASLDSGEQAACHDWIPALSRSTAKKRSVPLQDPSRRPKAAARQVPPLRLVPRNAPKEKERGVRKPSRSRSSPRPVSSAREAEQPRPHDNTRDKDRKTPVSMVLVPEGEAEGTTLSNRCN